MRSGLSAVGILLVCMAVAAGAQQQIDLFISFVTDGGAPVDRIDEGAIRVMENGVDANILRIEPVSPETKVQVLIDNGIGLGRDNLIHLRNGVRGLFEALPQNVETALLTTSPQPRFLVRPTTDLQALRKGGDQIAPDSGTGRFIDSMTEAVQRIERDKERLTLPVIIAVATTFADNDAREGNVERLMQRIGQSNAIVHVVVLSNTLRSEASSANAIEVGVALTKMTGGRYEGITAGSRIATLLPELGAEVAKSHALHRRQFRISVERPNGASGPLGKISLGSRGGIKAATVSLDGRIR